MVANSKSSSENKKGCRSATNKQEQVSLHLDFLIKTDTNADTVRGLQRDMDFVLQNALRLAPSDN